MATGVSVLIALTALRSWGTPERAAYPPPRQRHPSTVSFQRHEALGLLLSGATASPTGDRGPRPPLV